MSLVQWTLGRACAEFGVGDDWATLYAVASGNESHGEATELLRQAKAYYESQRKHVGGTVALNPAMKHIYEKLGFEEYTDGGGK